MTLFLLYLRLKEHLMYSQGVAQARVGFAEAKPTLPSALPRFALA
jgi:hypothetical protein